MTTRASQAGNNGSGGGGKRITQNQFTEKAWQAVVAAPEVARDASQQVSPPPSQAPCHYFQP
jgi:ATP-dependent Clp protease ATP-binding subunit ClpB